MSLICSFDEAKNRHYLYRGKDWLENFCKKLKELGTEIINYEEKEMTPSMDEEIKSYKEQKECSICKGFFAQIKIMKIILKTKKSEIIVITPENLGDLLIVFSI